ncbi:MAG TPA: GH32 C-terminal domain-containing protein [Actinocrinis sp.]|nr:GH32 C-terminal domain-containing protein [Actinocrinis sp.]
MRSRPYSLDEAGPVRRRRRRLAAAALALGALLLPATASAAGADTAAAGSDGAAAYHEPYRPQYHFTPAQNWMNDPNGLIYYHGQYNLFFQYNPSGSSWGNIEWGHAVSTDLVHWTEQPVAIPQDAGEYVFSGSVVYDKTNSSGLGTALNPPLVAVYTSAQKATGVQRQALAYSLDGGTTWTKYSGNPVLDLGSQNFRDPKVFWNAPGNEWLMVVARSDLHEVYFYSSTDLKQWTYLSEFGPAGATGGVWECPDLYPLPVDGNARDVKWVLVVNINPGSYAGGSGAQYFVGTFNGTTFTSDDPAGYTPPSGNVFADFEGSGYGDGWTTTGAAFGNGPAQGTLAGQQTVTGYLGHGLVNSFINGDSTTGTLTSPSFTVSQPYINFLVGGGDHAYVPGGVPYGTAPPGPVFDDFSSGWGSGWSATGDFANAGPTAESLPGQIDPRALDTCVVSCDPAEGTITSPAFTVNSNYIDFLIAGGDHPMDQPNPTAINLLINGGVVATATGKNSGEMDWTSWNVAQYKGQQATIQVVDQNNGSTGWGHLMVDHIVFSSAAAAPYNPQTGVNLLVDGKVVDSATGQNAEALDWTSWNVSSLIGKTAQLQIVDDNVGGWGHVNADQITFADTPALSSIQRAHWIDYGEDFYATASYNDAPGGKRIEIAWMNNWDYGGNIPTSPWRSADTFPRELSLRTIDGAVRLVQQPVNQLKTLRQPDAYNAAALSVTNGTQPLGASGQALEINADLNAGNAARFGLDVRVGSGQYTQIGYDVATQRLYIDRSHSGNTGFDPTFYGVQSAPLPLDCADLKLHVLVDASSVEVFADQGEVVLTDQIFPDSSAIGVDAFAADGSATVRHLTAWRLSSIWP